MSFTQTSANNSLLAIACDLVCYVNFVIFKNEKDKANENKLINA
jgi:hypothetical protein